MTLELLELPTADDLGINVEGEGSQSTPANSDLDAAAAAEGGGQSPPWEDATPAAVIADAVATDPAADVQPVADQSTPAEPAPLAATPSPATPNLDAYIRFKQRLSDATAELAAAVLHRIEIEEIYKAAKKREKAAGENLSEIANNGPAGMREAAQASGDLDEDSAAVDSASTPAEPAPESETAAHAPIVHVASEISNDHWRAISVDQLDLKPAMIAFLVKSGMETLGSVEDIRAGYGGLRSIKGVGQAKADAIEDAVLKWLSVNRDAAVLAEAREAAQIKPVEKTAGGQGYITGDEPPPAAVEQSTPAEAKPEVQAIAIPMTPANLFVPVNTSSPTWTNENLTDDERIADLRQRADAILKDAVVSDGEIISIGGSIDKTEERAYESGKDAWSAGYEVEDCPYAMAPAIDAWLRGFLSGKVLEAGE